MTDPELLELYWAAFEAEIRDVYKGDSREMSNIGWDIVKQHADTPSTAGLRAVFESGVAGSGTALHD